MDGKMPDNTESGAGDELAAPPQVGDMAPKGVTIPADMMPGCKVGDTYTVKSMDNDNIMLEPAGGSEEDGEGWGEGLAKAAPREAM